MPNLYHHATPCGMTVQKFNLKFPLCSSTCCPSFSDYSLTSKNIASYKKCYFLIIKNNISYRKYCYPISKVQRKHEGATWWHDVHWNGMDAASLRRQYGRQIVMWGNVDKREIAKGRRAIDAEMRRLHSRGGRAEQLGEEGHPMWAPVGITTSHTRSQGSIAKTRACKQARRIVLLVWLS